MAIANLNTKQLLQPITIEAVPSDQDDKVLFCRVWLGTQKVFQRWDETTHWRDVAKKAIDNVAPLQPQG
ncbi:hypothetical protein [Acaryochloris sp. CCMEE 5410]|nr:hypothetical protein [Acaryochloris sp. CCMEE 5410]